MATQLPTESDYLNRMIEVGNRLCKETAQFVVYSEEDGHPEASDAIDAVGDWQALMTEIGYDRT